MFRSHDHPQGAYIVPCQNYNLKHSVNYFVAWDCLSLRLNQSHAAQHKTHNHNQAHPKHRTTHTQKHDMLPQHQS